MKTAQRLGTWLLVFVSFVLAPAASRGEDEDKTAGAPVQKEDAVVAEQHEGQRDLDKALAAKPSAKDYRGITRVVNLTQAALNKGLDKKNIKVAKKLLAATLMDRATLVSLAILGQKTPNPRWPQLRKAALVDLRRLLNIDSNQPRAYYLRGRLLALSGGDKARAIEALDKAIHAEGVDGALRTKALILRGNLQSDEAKRLADYAEAIKFAPNDPEPLRTRALYLLLQGKTDQAIVDLNRALELEPEHAATYEVRGMALFIKKNYDEALLSFDRALELDPKSASLHMHRGRVFAARGDTRAAITEFDKAVEIKPNDVGYLMIRAQMRLANEDSDGALADIEEVLRLRPDNVAARHWLAQIQASSQKMDEAIASLERLTRIMPDDAKLITDNVTELRMRAKTLANSGKMDEAIASLERLTRILPNDAKLMFQLGVYYIRNEQPRHAIKVFDTLLAKDSMNWQALRTRGDAYLAIGKQAEAIADYEAALKLQPENSGLLNNLSWVLATAPDDKLRDGRRAQRLATKACELTAYKQASILSTLAAAYAENGDFKTAIEWSEKSVELRKDSIGDPLTKELDSYKRGKPWRESQSIEEREPKQQEPQ